MKKVSVSVVIPTHKGGKKLPKLISSIKKNSIWPSEIIICGTKKSDFFSIDNKIKKLLNIKFILSKIKNQVHQRRLAINFSKYKVIFQLDDDVYLDKDYIQNMYQHFRKKKKKIVISAVIYSNDNYHQGIRWNKAYYENPVFRILLFILNGFSKIKYMSIIRSGRIIPLIPKIILKSDTKKKKFLLKNLEWLCSSIAYYKKDYKKGCLFSLNQKKSYYEDVFFSHSLFKKKYKLILDNSCIAYHPKNNPTTFSIFKDTISAQFNIVKKFRKNYILFVIDVFIFSLIYLILQKNEN